MLNLEQYELGNGLRVVLNEDHSAPLVEVNLWYHVGSKNERPGRTGFAHLFEHMLFSDRSTSATTSISATSSRSVESSTGRRSSTGQTTSRPSPRTTSPSVSGSNRTAWVSFSRP